MDGSFFDWLAGFIDGEGCFQVRRHPRGHYFCTFILRVRDDDDTIIKEIVARTGVGVVRRLGRNGKGGHDTVNWYVERKADALALVSLLDAHPLRAKKARDYEVWRRAVMLWCDHKHGESWDEVATAQLELVEGRRHPLDRIAA